MQTTLRDADPHDIFVIEPDVVLAARADQPSHEGAIHTPPVDTTFRATDVSDIHVANDHNPLVHDRPSNGKWAKRAAIGFAFALVSASATAAWEHYGDAAKAKLATWVPPFVLAASPAADKPAVAEQVSADATTAAATEQTAAPTQTAAAPVVDTAAADAAQVQAMTRDLAALGQQVAQLKASLDQLRDSQAQMSRDMARNAEARTSDVNLRPKLSAVSPTAQPRPPAPVVHKPKPPVQAAAAPLPPPQTMAAPVPLAPAPQQQATAQDGGPVVRPPLPLR